MKVRLTLGEKLRDLRDEKKMKLSGVSEATGIPLATLQRTESNEDIRVGYQDITVLANFYGVSTDYLFGMTDNRQYRNIEIDRLRLSDEVIAVLKSGKLNNRLLSEFLSHPGFAQLLSSMEVYIDRKVLPQMNTMNAMCKFAENAIIENFDVSDGDEIMLLLQESVVDEDEYLRYRISERFNIIMKSLFDAHKKDKLPDGQSDMIKDMKENLQCYLSIRDNPDRGKLIVLAKQLGLNLSELSDEEIVVLIKSLQRSEKYKRVKKRK